MSPAIPPASTEGSSSPARFRSRVIRSLREAPLLQKILLATFLLLAAVAVHYLVFQIDLQSCSRLSYDECWRAYYTPPIPPKENFTGILQLEVKSVENAYGYGQPVWVRIADYFRLMLTGSYQFNVGGGGGLAGLVLSTVSYRSSNTVPLVILSAFVAWVLGGALRLVSGRKDSRGLGPPALAVFLLLDVVVAGFFVWAISTTLHPGGLTWVTSFLISLVPHGYGVLGMSTLGKTGLAYDVAYLQALSLPFAYLTFAAFLTLVLVRIANRGKIYYMTALGMSVLAALAWALVVEIFCGWPGLGQAIYYAEIAVDLPLEQAAFFTLTLVALETIFIAHLARDAVSYVWSVVTKSRSPSADAGCNTWRQNRPVGITVLSVFQILGGVLLLPIVAFLWVMTLPIASSFLEFLLSLLLLYSGWGLWSGKFWAWWLNAASVAFGILLAVVEVASGVTIQIPGLVVGVVLVWYLFRPGTKQFFEAGSMLPTSTGQ